MKKFLSITLAGLTILNSVSVSAESNTSKAKSSFSKGRICTAVIIGAAAVAGAITFPYVGAKAYDYFNTITVGTPGRHLTRDDLKKHSKKEEVVIDGLMPRSVGIAGKKILVNVVRAKIIKVRDGVTSIDDHTFEDCIVPEKIIIPNSVKHIEENAFSFSPAISGYNLKINYNGKDYAGTSDFINEFKKCNK